MKKTGRVKTFILFVTLLLITAGLWTIDIRGDVSSTDVYMGESFELTVSVNSDRDETLPSPSRPKSDGDFRIHDTRSMTSMKIINGKITKTQKTIYEMTPARTGTYTIYPGSIVVGGREKHASPVKVKVSSQPKSRKAGTGKTFFVEAEVSTVKPYVGQQLTYLFKLYIDQNYLRRVSSLDLSTPEFTGFWKEQIKERQYTARVNGRIYKVYEVPTVLFPTRSGEFDIEPSRITFIYSEPRGKSQSRNRRHFGNSIFNDPFFSGMSYKRTRKSFVTKRVKLDVKELPSGVSVPVGKFKMDFRINKQRLREHDAITAVITLEGDGNINDFNEPFISLPDGFKKFSSKSEVSKKIVGKRIYGQKTFEFAIVPEKKGKYKLGPVEFNYFDTESGRVRELKSKQYDVTVEKGETQILSQNIANGETTLDNSKTPSGDDVLVKAVEIRTIKGNRKKLVDQQDVDEVLDGLYFHLGFWACLPVFGYLYSRDLFRFGHDEKIRTVRRSLKVAFAGLDQLHHGNRDDFKTMYSIIQKFINTRFSISVADVTASNIQKKLVATGVEEDISREFAEMMQEINFYSMSGMKDNKEFTEFKSCLKEVIGKLHSQKNRGGQA